jgi:general secretion pathway protein C
MVIFAFATPTLSRLATVNEVIASWRVHMPWAVSLVFAILLCWQVVQVWHVVRESEATRFLAAAPAAAVPQEEPTVDVEAIVGAHLFGDANAAVDPNPNEVALTEAPLVLVGTIAYSDPTKGYAIVGESATSAKLVAVGTQIVDGSRLRSVFPDRVILERGEILEALILPRKYSASDPAPPEAQEDPRLALLAANPPPDVSQVMSTELVYENGRLKGYRVAPSRNREVFADYGLMPGDVITEVNGGPLDTPAIARQALKLIGQDVETNLTIERKGEQMVVVAKNTQLERATESAQANVATSESESGESQPPQAEEVAQSDISQMD